MSKRKIDLSLTPEQALWSMEIRTEEDYKTLQAKIKSMSNRR